MFLKVCGITEKTNVEKLKDSVDLLGFIFHAPSPRNAFETDPGFIKSLSTHFATVGVFVDQPVEIIDEICSRRGIRTVQLHGNENPESAAQLRKKGYKVIKAFRINEDSDIELNRMVEPFRGCADLLLFDTGGKHAGGNGVKFNWSILKSYKGDTPYVLSGGIGPEDARIIREMDSSEFPRLQGLDLNSRFEVLPGEKDTEVILKFIEELSNYE